MANESKKNSIGINAEHVSTIRKFKNLVELETNTVFSLGSAAYLGALVCNKIMDGEKITKAEVVEIARGLSA